MWGGKRAARIDKALAGIIDRLRYIDSSLRQLSKVLTREGGRRDRAELEAEDRRFAVRAEAAELAEMVRRIPIRVLVDFLQDHKTTSTPETYAIQVSLICRAMDIHRLEELAKRLPDTVALALPVLVATDSLRMEVLKPLNESLRALLDSEMWWTVSERTDLAARIIHMLKPSSESRNAVDRFRAEIGTADDLFVDGADLHLAGLKAFRDAHDHVVQCFIRNIDHHTLAHTLRVEAPDVQQRFLDNMSNKAGKILAENMAHLEPIRAAKLDRMHVEVAAVIMEMVREGHFDPRRWDAGSDGPGEDSDDDLEDGRHHSPKGFVRANRLEPGCGIP